VEVGGLVDARAEASGAPLRQGRRDLGLGS